MAGRSVAAARRTARHRSAPGCILSDVPPLGWGRRSDETAGLPAISGGVLGTVPHVEDPNAARRADLEHARRALELAMWLGGPTSRGRAQPPRDLAANSAPSLNTPPIPIAPTAVAGPPQQQPAGTRTPPAHSPADLRAVMPAPQAIVWGDETPGDTRAPPTAADVRDAINADRVSPNAVPKRGQTLPPAFSPDEAQSQLNRMTGAVLRGLVPESLKPDSDEDIAEWNRRMTWYMQHPEYQGRLDLPWLKSEHPREAMLLGALDGLMWGMPAEGAVAKLAPAAKAALRAMLGGAERSAVRGAVRAGTEQLPSELAGQADRLLHPGTAPTISDATALRSAPIDHLIAGAPRQPHTAYATHEFVPGGTTGHLPELQAGSEAEKAAYSRNPLESAARESPRYQRAHRAGGEQQARLGRGTGRLRHCASGRAEPARDHRLGARLAPTPDRRL